jgi:hypothetical protein
VAEPGATQADGGSGVSASRARLPLIAAVAAACGFTLFAVLDLTGHGTGALAKAIVVASIACVAVVRLATDPPRWDGGEPAS